MSDFILPLREAAIAKGWTHQVQWTQDGKPCFMRCKSGHEADAWADKLKKFDPVLVDLKDALQI